MRKCIKIIILIGCLCSMCFFGYKIYNYLSEDKASKDLNQNLIETAVTEITTEDLDNNSLPIQVDFEVLKQKNTDIIGWIYSENSPINFPVVQSTDNQYYLRRLIDRTYNRAGTIFMDYRNNKGMSDWNTIIYGHNMKNDTMFGTLMNYKEQSYYDSHKTMYYLTEKKTYKVELIAGYIESADSSIYDIPTKDNNKKQILENAKNKSTFKSEFDFGDEEKILTLSTCSYEYDDARYILIGILK